MDSRKLSNAKHGSKSSKDLKQKSPAEFFSENKNIAGFDNPGKCLYTTIRELVENALDSAEAVAKLPEIELTVEEITRSQFNALIGLKDQDRVDKQLYEDFETDKEREKRMAREAKEVEKLAKAGGKKPKDQQQQRAGKARGDLFYKVTCKDNGRGMPHNDIPNMLGKVLSGTKYGLRQTRGKFGLGAKMALIWSKMSTGLPIEIWSSMEGQDYMTFCRLDIDIHSNTPNIHVHEKQPNPNGFKGAELQVTIEANWINYRAKIINYLRQMAVITPYAQFWFRFIGSTADKNISIRFARRTDVMPAPPRETKYHPSAVDLLVIKRLIASTTKPTLSQFLVHEFQAIGKSYAERLIGELGPEFSSKMPVKSLNDQQVHRLNQLFREAKFDGVDGECLSPAGEYNMRLGVMKELSPDMVATFQGSTQVFEGHPFIVEAAVSLGGKTVKPGINVFRFANRIPLLFEPGADVITRTAMKRVNWGSYKINHVTDKVGVFVSIVSTKIPFKGTSKEYIGDDIAEIAAGVKAAIQQCCLQLKSKIVRQQQAKARQQRKKDLARYIPDVSRAMAEVLEAIGSSDSRKRPWSHLSSEGVELVEKVAREEVTEATFRQRLMQHVEQVDSEMAALEFATQVGKNEGAPETVFIPALLDRSFAPELHSPTCVLQLFQGCY